MKIRKTTTTRLITRMKTGAIRIGIRRKAIELHKEKLYKEKEV
jgi:hypothetical protein